MTATDELTRDSEEVIAGRIRRRLHELGRIGSDGSGGVTRLAYTREERQAHELFAEWVAEDGGRVELDEAGNSIAIYKDGEPFFLTGSHLDTVLHGGLYDGAAGVVGALEVARLVGQELSLGLRVVAFAAEEGARFGRPTLGSAFAAALVGDDAYLRLRDANDKSLHDAATELGLDPLAVKPWLGDQIACFFEIHIEQGRQLEAGAARIGLVDAIAGSVRLRFDIRGRADHSGATPMRMRLDALAAASDLVLAVEQAGRAFRSTVATVGKLEVGPNSVTTVPEHVRLWIDIRDVDADVQRSATNAILARADEIGEARGVAVSGEVISDMAPVVLEAWPRSLAHEECEAQGLTYRVLSSGAGHDAAIVARQAPATMLFIPCVDGVSHSPHESASPADIAAAAAVIAATIKRADRLLA